MKKVTVDVSASLLAGGLTLGVGIIGVCVLLAVLSPQSKLSLSALFLEILFATGMIYTTSSLFRQLKAHREKGTVDSLTGLLNREALMNHLDVELAKDKSTVALLFMDLNKFKVVNDTLGHRSGDELLVQAGLRIKSVITNRCTLARLGGDEFAIVISRASDKDIEYVARSVSEQFQSPFELTTGMVEVGVSIGISTFPIQASTVLDLTRFADLAMYEAKRTAQPYVFFSSSLVHSSEEALYIGSNLRSAIDRDQLVVEYQPKLSLKSGDVVGAEALVRWDHPILGRVMPDKFIPIAEQQGIINSITDWVLETSLKDLILCRQAGMPLKSISVNISPFSVINGDLLITIAKALAAVGLEPHDLVVEVTETSIQHKSEALIKILICMDVMGVGISIDDFGTGQSSLLYLKYLPTTEIKVDKSFIKNIRGSVQDKAIVKALVQLAHTLGCEVCAEGVETEEIREELSDMGCDTIQGFLISKALPIREFIRAFGVRDQLVAKEFLQSTGMRPKEQHHD